MAFQARLHRLVDRLAGDDPGRFYFHLAKLAGRERRAAVDGLAERVDDAAEELFADRNRDDLSGTIDLIALANRLESAQKGDADVVLFEVQNHSGDGRPIFALKFDQLAGHCPGQPVDAGDAVAGR